MNIFVIGDIHGCFTELQELLDKAGILDDDLIIALGDIVDRGPDSAQVLDFFSNNPSRLSLMGNHERKHVRGARHEVRLALSQIISREEFGASYQQALERMGNLPLFLDLPRRFWYTGMWNRASIWSSNGTQCYAARCREIIISENDTPNPGMPCTMAKNR